MIIPSLPLFTSGVAKSGQFNRLRDVSAFILNPPAAMMTCNAAQNITSGGSYQLLTFGSTSYDNDSMVTSSSRLTIKTAGRYSLVAKVTYASNANGRRYLTIRKNGTDLLAETAVPPSGASATVTIAAGPEFQLSVGDYIEAFGFQDSGSTLATSTGTGTHLAMRMVQTATTMSGDEGLSLGSALNQAELTTQDLNALNTPGFYIQSDTTEATLARNYPVDATRGHLLVESTGGASPARVMQTFTTSASTAAELRRFVRTYASPTWSPWVELGAGSSGKLTVLSGGSTDLADGSATGTLLGFRVTATSTIEGQSFGPGVYIFERVSTGWEWRSIAAGTVIAVTTPDTTPPTAGTLSSSSVTSTGFTLTVTGASDNIALDASPYSFSTDNGSTWTAYQPAASLTVTGKTASTAYTCEHRVRDAAGNVTTGTSIVVTTAGFTYADTMAADDPTTVKELNGRALTTRPGTQTWAATAGQFEVNGAAYPGWANSKAAGTTIATFQTATQTAFTLSAIEAAVGGNPALVFRYKDANNYLAVSRGGGGLLQLIKVVAGTATEIANGGTVSTAEEEQSISVTVNGTSCNVSFKGVQLITGATLPTSGAGETGVGFLATQANIRFRNFSMVMA